MLSHELKSRLDTYLHETAGFAPFFDCVATLSAAYKPVQQCHAGIAAGGNNINNHGNQLHAHLASTSQITSVINPRRFYAAVEGVLSLLHHTFEGISPAPQYLEILTQKIDSFVGKFDIFLSTQTGVNAAPLLFEAHSLHQSLSDFKSMIEFVGECVEPTNLEATSEQTLSLLLPSHMGLRDFSERLRALDRIYSEICMLLSISDTSEPLRITKIESGSLWVKVFGNSKVIEMMTHFLEASVSFIYRTYTTEGKLASIPRKVESLDAIIGLSERLVAAGVNTPELNEHISKTAVLIAQDLNSLLAGQPHVEINLRIYSIDQEFNQQLLEMTKTPQLSHDTGQTLVENENVKRGSE